MVSNIACVIVTYNRKDYLKRCLEAVADQRLKPNVVYITDNASTDGTIDSVKEWGFYNSIKDQISYKYVLNSKNEGGAGGFFLGMKTAFEDGVYDALWVMDDDGEPDSNCLFELAPYLKKYDCIAPLVLSDVDHISTCFTYGHEPADVFIKSMRPVNGIIERFSSPFNGILYSSRYIEKVGFPNKKMFIWGDEMNYKYRGYNQGLIDVTIIAAKHYHPVGRKDFVSYRGEIIAIVNRNWMLYCFLRNYWYNDIHIVSPKPAKVYLRTLKKGVKYGLYYQKHLNRFIWPLVFDAYISAVLGLFFGLAKYRKN